MITIKDILGTIIIMLLFVFYALFKDDPIKGFDNAKKAINNVSGEIKKIIKRVEKI